MGERSCGGAANAAEVVERQRVMAVRLKLELQCVLAA